MLFTCFTSFISSSSYICLLLFFPPPLSLFSECSLFLLSHYLIFLFTSSTESFCLEKLIGQWSYLPLHLRLSVPLYCSLPLSLLWYLAVSSSCLFSSFLSSFFMLLWSFTSSSLLSIIIHFTESFQTLV